MSAEPPSGKPASAALNDQVRELLLWVAVRGFVDKYELQMRWEHAAPIRHLVEVGLLGVDGGFVLVTPRGESQLSAALESLVGKDRVGLEGFYTAFEELDRELKALATEWQELRARPEEDPDRVVDVAERWAELDQQLRRAVVLSSAAGRLLGSYLPLLDSARQAFEGGDWDRLTGVAEDSYHSAWYAMHETLLRALGKQRAG
ncbi:MAG: hypothetical protein DLM67_18330 [Candidatus Nephthysia bennettiae]|uniref:Uncharacterized protein n=1 Tax=Candidatus Nephthysia bennettiae TaxID=3127016 RepID=A0A934NFM8_9BACT|nr:hypothetical protein [Candidatus Dormibacteraeota bacterium]MBJ7614013.1 hypothetical protein [Candidatus Dormibacteraeota bacterium]PZR90142.1 MAG: hypothetical protein DLM67_18330 [Candidatus Dormibacteraeota bacterium]